MHVVQNFIPCSDLKPTIAFLFPPSAEGDYYTVCSHCPIDGSDRINMNSQRKAYFSQYKESAILSKTFVRTRKGIGVRTFIACVRAVRRSQIQKSSFRIVPSYILFPRLLGDVQTKHAKRQTWRSLSKRLSLWNPLNNFPLPELSNSCSLVKWQLAVGPGAHGRDA